MGGAEDLSEFDRGQVVMARRLGLSASETGRMLGLTRAAVLSVYRGWDKDGQTVPSRLPPALQPGRSRASTKHTNKQPETSQSSPSSSTEQ